MAVASLVLGIVGTVFGLIPLTAFIALICGVLAVVFGLVGLRKARSGAPGKGMAVAGVVLGSIAFVLAVVGLVILNNVVTDLEAMGDDPNQP